MKNCHPELPSGGCRLPSSRERRRIGVGEAEICRCGSATWHQAAGVGAPATRGNCGVSFLCSDPDGAQRAKRKAAPADQFGG